MPDSNKQYELTFILGEKAGLEEGKAKTEEVKKFIKSLKGEVTKEELWGRRELAYIIKRNRTGFYVTLWLSLPAENLRNLDEFLRFDTGIIRSLVTLAYTEAQPGSLYPVVEEEKTERRPGSKTEETVSAEEMLRRGTGSSKKEKVATESEEDAIPEEERLKKLDESLEKMLKDEKEEV